MGEVELFRVIRGFQRRDGIFHHVLPFVTMVRGFVGRLMKEVGRMQAVICDSCVIHRQRIHLAA